MNRHLHRVMAPLLAYIADPQLEEIALMHPGTVWQRWRRSDRWVPVPAPELDWGYLVQTMAVAFANTIGEPFDPLTHPYLRKEVPGLDLRLNLIAGHAVAYGKDGTGVNRDHARGGIALNLRSLADADLDFADFSFAPGQLLVRPLGDGDNRKYADDAYEDFCLAVQNGRNVLISGATSTGKTSFLRHAVRTLIPAHHRIVTVEDTHELELAASHENRVHLLTAHGAVDGRDRMLLDCVVRMSPDAIVGSEISIANTSAMVRLATTGHRNFMVTIHAESPREALEAIVQNMRQNGEAVEHDATMAVLQRIFHRVIQIDRHGSERGVTHSVIPGLGT